MRGLRGTAFDLFGYTAERRMERALIGEFEQTVEQLLKGLEAANLEQARLMQLAEEEERHADQVWRELHEEARRRQLKAEQRAHR